MACAGQSSWEVSTRHKVPWAVADKAHLHQLSLSVEDLCMHIIHHNTCVKQIYYYCYCMCIQYNCVCVYIYIYTYTRRSTDHTRYTCTNHAIHQRAADAVGEVKAQRRGSDVKHLAKVLSVGWECDAAVLTVENDELPGWWRRMVKMIQKGLSFVCQGWTFKEMMGVMTAITLLIGVIASSIYI